LKALDVVFLPK